MATERQPGMVIGGVEHRPEEIYLRPWDDNDPLPEYICSECVSHWPCRPVVVAALKGALREQAEKVRQWKRHSEGQSPRRRRWRSGWRG